MPRVRRRAKARTWNVTTDEWELVNDRDPGNGFQFLIDEQRLREVWELCRDAVLGAWIDTNPGTRPSLWWKYDAPRWSRPEWKGCYWNAAIEQPRIRIGGKGTPAYEALAYAPHLEKGIPTSYVMEWAVEYYNGRAVDVNGNPVDTEYKDGHFPHEAYDPDEPPQYESELEYLQRHGLLFDGEYVRALDAAASSDD